MSFQIRPLLMETDYPAMVGWWEERKFPSPNRDLLPPDGLIVSHLGQRLAGGFLFQTNANVAIIGNVVSDPKVANALRSEAVDYLILGLTELGRGSGFLAVACSTNLTRLMERYERLGFLKTDENVSHFGRIF